MNCAHLKGEWQCSSCICFQACLTSTLMFVMFTNQSHRAGLITIGDVYDVYGVRIGPEFVQSFQGLPFPYKLIVF